MSNESNKDMSLTKRLQRMIAGDRKTSVIVLIGLCGVLLLAASVLFGREDAAVTTDTYDAMQYTQELETRLEAMVTSVRGAGACDVMVTLENGVEYIYANEEKSNTDHTQNGSGDVSSRDDNQKTVVTIEAANGKQGLLVTEIQPTVRGVVVACEGAADQEVASLVKEAVKTALNITDRRVCVIPLS